MLSIRVTGLFSGADDAQRLLEAMTEAQAERHAVKIVADMRGCVLLVCAEDWPAVTRVVLASEPTLTPVAFLVSQGDWHALFEHCMTLSRYGRARYVFSEPERVVEWAGAPLVLRPPREFEPLSGPPPCRQS